MKIYDRKGMLIIPPPPPHKHVTKKCKDMLLVKECYCRNGHELIGKRAMFNGHPGIYLKAKLDDKEGFIGLSPMYGEKCRISLDIDLPGGAITELLCPTCDEGLPVFSPCNCGGEILALFLNNKGDFSDCIGICNRVDCNNAAVKSEGELLCLSMVDCYDKKCGLLHPQDTDEHHQHQHHHPHQPHHP